MVRNVTVILLLLVALSARSASADSYDNCVSVCTQAKTDCVNGITLYDPAGIEEAKASCGQTFDGCKKQCHEVDEIGQEAYDKQQKQQAEDSGKKPLEEQADNGGIKLYQPPADGGIKTYQFNQ